MFKSEISNRAATFIWLTVWIGLAISFTLTLPSFSEFEASKYLNISHSMVEQHDLLLAYWHGHPYNDSSPLLFWLILAGWQLFGFSNWWPQLLVMCFATASLFLTQQLAKTLWPENPTVAKLTPFIMVGCFYWMWFAKQIRVDSILVLASIMSLYFACRTLTHGRKNWLGYVFAVGLGAFTKGPMILVFIVLPALFLPGLMKQQKIAFSPAWYGWLGLMTLLGFGSLLFWAIPAMMRGGHAFQQEVLYHQITHHMQMKQESTWFYLVRLPLWLLPWTLYPAFWQGVFRAKKQWGSPGVIICLITLSSALVVFSVFGQKLPHYLYPLFPIFSLLIAFFCTQSRGVKHWHQWPIAFLLMGLAAFCLGFSVIHTWLPYQSAVRSFFLKEVNLTAWGITFFIAALGLLLFRPSTRLIQIISLALTTVLLTVFINDTVLPHYRQHLGKKGVQPQVFNLSHQWPRTSGQLSINS